MSDGISIILQKDHQPGAERDAATLAHQIVSLIEKTEVAGFIAAEGLLFAFYEGDRKKMAMAYELACRVVLKRIQRRPEATKATDSLRPFANWMLARAAQEAFDGLLQESFRHLRISVKAGAPRPRCRKVIACLLSRLDSKDRVCVLIYRKERVVSVDIGKIDDAGVMIMSGNAQKHPQYREWGRERSAHGERFFLRNCEEWDRERILPLLKPRSRTKGRFLKEALGDSLNWVKYFELLCVKDSVQPLKAA